MLRSERLSLRDVAMRADVGLELEWQERLELALRQLHS